MIEANLKTYLFNSERNFEFFFMSAQLTIKEMHVQISETN